MKMSFINVVNFSALKTDKPSEELLTLIQRHKKIPGIKPDMCDNWVESVIKTAKELDPKFNNTVEEAWREVLAPGIEIMRFDLCEK